MADDRAHHALLRPASVALVGASDDPNRPSGRPLRFLRRDGWKGRIYPVNARRDTVQGERAWASLDVLPEVPDHVFVLTPTETVVDVIAECGRLGVPVATILAGGFAESGPPGAARGQALRGTAKAGRVRILGPGSIGLVDTRTGLTLTANAAFSQGVPATGSTFVASQSGSLIGALVSRAAPRGIGFAALVSVGAESDLTLGEICAASLDDPGVASYALFLETLVHAGDLRAFALGAAARGRPVVAYKLGRSDAAAELTVTHTGALAGPDDLAGAFLADCGIARVATFEALIETAALAVRAPTQARPGPPRVGVLTATGGGAAMVVDELASRGLAVTAPSEATLARLVEAVGFDVGAARIVDLTLRGTGAVAMSAALAVLRACGEFDAVVQVVGSSATSQPDVATLPMIDAPLAGTPVACFVVPEAAEALRRLGEAGAPAFRTPESCADAVAAVLTRRPPRSLPDLPAPQGPTGRVLAELDAYALLDRIGVAHPRVVTVIWGDRVPADVDYPVAVKGLVSGLTHKSDIGAVVLDIGDEAALTVAMASIRAEAAKLDLAEITKFALQPMVDGVAEVLVGFRCDPQVGPIIVVAAGGTLAELGSVRSIRMAPVDADLARVMIAEIPGLAQLLGGYRGRPAGNVAALAAAIAAVSSLGFDSHVIEAEINPIIVTAEDAVAVDVVARVV